LPAEEWRSANYSLPAEEWRSAKSHISKSDARTYYGVEVGQFW
jgi:hypothetical protein